MAVRGYSRNGETMKILMSLAILLTSCQVVGTIGSQHVRCYSGGVLVLETDTDGTVMADGAGLFKFRDAKTGQIVEVTLQCVIGNP